MNSDQNGNLGFTVYNFLQDHQNAHSQAHGPAVPPIQPHAQADVPQNMVISEVNTTIPPPIFPQQLSWNVISNSELQAFAEYLRQSAYTLCPPIHFTLIRGQIVRIDPWLYATPIPIYRPSILPWWAYMPQLRPQVTQVAKSKPPAPQVNHSPWKSAQPPLQTTAEYNRKRFCTKPPEPPKELPPQDENTLMLQLEEMMKDYMQLDSPTENRAEQPVPSTSGSFKLSDQKQYRSTNHYQHDSARMTPRVHAHPRPRSVYVNSNMRQHRAPFNRRNYDSGRGSHDGSKMKRLEDLDCDYMQSMMQFSKK